MNTDDYKYVIKVVFDNVARYYNSGSYCLVANPIYATRYKDKDTTGILEDKEYACCQGGEGSIVDLEVAKSEYGK